MKNLILVILFLGVALVVGVLVWNIFGGLVTNNPTLSKISEAVGAPAPQSNSFIFDTEEQIDAALGQGSTPPIITEKDIEPVSEKAGSVTIVRDRDGIQYTFDSNIEYLTLRANPENTAPIAISGWTLRSMLSNNTAIIPDGSASFALGEQTALAPITLSPGEYAVITTNQSPFGFSFRTNACIGFLDTFTQLTPRVIHECVEPSIFMPATLENIKTYGESCIDFASHFPTCTYITEKTPGVESLSYACRAHLAKNLTYNNCVLALQKDPAFSKRSEWRIYLGGTRRLWKQTYEAIQLLDENGKTVDVYAY